MGDSRVSATEPGRRLAPVVCGTTVVLGGALALGLGAGLLAHEFAHAVVARALGIECTVDFLPNWDGTLCGVLTGRPLAHVTPLPSIAVSPWRYRAAAVAPLALTAPVVIAGVSGHVPADDPTPLTVLAICWLACALPSPQDFSVAFHVHAYLEGIATEHPTAGRTPVHRDLGEDDNPPAVDVPATVPGDRVD